MMRYIIIVLISIFISGFVSSCEDQRYITSELIVLYKIKEHNNYYLIVRINNESKADYVLEVNKVIYDKYSPDDRLYMILSLMKLVDKRFTTYDNSK